MVGAGSRGGGRVGGVAYFLFMDHVDVCGSRMLPLLQFFSDHYRAAEGRTAYNTYVI